MGTGTWAVIIIFILLIVGMLVVGNLVSKHERKVEHKEKELKSQQNNQK